MIIKKDGFIMIKMTTLTQEQIKEINRVKIIKLIKSSETTTKQEIAKELSLSIPTVTSNIQTLISEGLVEEAGVAESTGGRKPVILKFVKNARYAFGVSITSDSLEIILVNLNVEEIARVRLKDQDFKDFNSILEEVKDQIHTILKTYKIPREKVLGIGIALPGLVDDDQLILEYAPNNNVKNYDFKPFEREVGFKVNIENEANIAAFAELSMSERKEKDNLVYVSITEGIGTGIIIRNHIFKSNQKKAGEFGHIKIADQNRLCNCGRKDCWELYASKRALIRIYEKYTGVHPKDLDQIFKGDRTKEVEKALREYANYLLKGIENIILALNPDYVIIGGDLVDYEKEIIGLLADSNEHTIELESTKIIFSELKTSGALIGAALLPLEELFNYRKNVL